jgi:hypothetical protein
LSLAFRGAKEQITVDHLTGINEKIGAIPGALDDQPLSLAMDQSARASWDSSIAPHVAHVPFAMSGQGQQAIVKTILAMRRDRAQTARVVMIEEPDNHLSHTSLNQLLARIGDLAGEDQQLFVTTHSSFVLNRLGLDALALVSAGAVATFANLSEQTVRFFQKQPGFDTLRAVLAKRVVLVEGPSDEIMFNHFYMAAKDRLPLEDGIDVITMQGVSLKRSLELAKVLGKQCAALRDNDGVEPAVILEGITDDLIDGALRQVFIGAVDKGRTLEPQLIAANDEAVIREALGIRKQTNLASWMTNNKTEAALRLAEGTTEIAAPQYFIDAIEFISA